MQLTPEMHAAIRDSVLCWLATVDAEGQPSVSPKEVFLADGDDLLIAHIASPRSVRNIAGNARVGVSMIDVFEQRGYQFTGRAEVVDPAHRDFPRLLERVESLTEGRYPVRAVIRVTLDSARPIVAPSSWLFPDVPSEARRAATLATYRVRDLADERGADGAPD